MLSLLDMLQPLRVVKEKLLNKRAQLAAVKRVMLRPGKVGK